MGTDATKEILQWTWAQGGAILLLIALLILALFLMAKYMVKALWDENKALRERVMTMNERVVTMGEASRQTNETCTKAFIEQSQAFRDMANALNWRQKT